jgi:hypothetical protein
MSRSCVTTKIELTTLSETVIAQRNEMKNMRKGKKLTQMKVLALWTKQLSECFYLAFEPCDPNLQGIPLGLRLFEFALKG